MVARPFYQASGEVEGEKPPAKSQVCIAGFNRDGIYSAHKAVVLSVAFFYGRQVENGARSQHIALCFEVNLLCREVYDKVEIVRCCFDLIEFANKGFAVVLENDFVLTKYMGFRKKQTN